MGCNRLGQDIRTEAEWIGLVHRAVELGVNLFDTAEAYGDWGGSEEILGKALVGRPDVLVATKVSRSRETGEKRFNTERVIKHAEQSLQRLQRDCIDIFQLHSPSLQDMQEYAWAEAMDKLKQQGKVRFAGVSINDAESGIWLIENNLAEVLQVRYSMLEPEVGDQVFPLAEEHGVGIMVRMPMTRGILTGKYESVEDVDEDNRARLMGEDMSTLIDRGNRFRPLAAEKGVTMAQFALQYAITPEAVSAAIPGARNSEQLEENVGASNGTGLSPEELDAVAEIQSEWLS
jgi:aryl-alcohol dehydrogenase-like predicted oxidoreductase